MEEVIKALEKKLAEARNIMNARYDEFNSIDDDYPHGPIGDPESLVNEEACKIWCEAIHITNMIRAGYKVNNASR